MADVPTKYFKGTTTTTVISTSTDIAAANFSNAPTATYDNTTDATLPYAPFALAMGEFPDWGGTPAQGSRVELWGVLKDTDGTDDDTDAPATTSPGGARFFGSWVITNADAFQRRTIIIDTFGCDKIDFYIKNGTAQNMNNDGGTSAVVKITPLALGVSV